MKYSTVDPEFSDGVGEFWNKAWISDCYCYLLVVGFSSDPTASTIKEKVLVLETEHVGILLLMRWEFLRIGVLE